MKKILFIVDQYYPESSANTNCLNNIIDVFKRKDFDISVLAHNVKADVNFKIVDNVKIFKFDTYATKLFKKGKSVNYVLESKLKKAIRKVGWGLRFVFKINRPRTENIYIDYINYNKLIKLLKKHESNFDFIVSVSAPFGLQIMASKLHKAYENSKWFPLLLDPFVYNYTLNQGLKSVNKRKNIVEKYFELASKIFMQKGIKENNEKQNYNPQYHEKVVDISLPNLIDRTKNSINSNNEKVELTYAGLFYRDIRNPEKMLDVLSTFDGQFKLVLIGNGCEEIVQNKKHLFNKCEINILGRKQKDECNQYLHKSNILVNLSNSIVNQVPSKVFEYIGLGKPIVNFYFTEEDPSLNYFKRYDLCFNLNLNDYTDKDVEDLKIWCLKNKNKQLTFEDATKNLINERADFICEKIYKELSNGNQRIVE